MTLEEARETALRYIAQHSTPELELALDDRQTVDRGRDWVFFYNSRAYLESGSIGDALAGNGPLAVNKESGELRVLPADRPWEETL
jgi:Immunity protein 35